MHPDHSKRAAPVKHWQVWLALTLIALLVHLGSRPGNWEGIDDFKLLYNGSQGVGFVLTNRPLHTLPIWLLHPFIGASALYGYWALMALRVINAGLAYQLTLAALPERRRFAILVALAYAAFNLPGASSLMNLPVLSVILLAVSFCLLAGWAYLRYLRSAHWPWLLLALASLAASLLAYEPGLPILAGLPLAALWFVRPHPRHHWWAVALWFIVIGLAGGLRIALPILSGEDYYITGVARGSSPAYLIGGFLLQWKYLLAAFTGAGLAPDGLSILSVVVVTLAAAWLLRPGHSESENWPSLVFLVPALELSFALVVAGFLPFLLTSYAGTTRTQFFSQPGTALLIAVLLGLFSLPLRRWSGQGWIMALSIGLLTGLNQMQFTQIQRELVIEADTWESVTELRILSQQISIRPGALLYLDWDYARACPPAMQPWSFTYGMRYFYEDAIAAGSVDSWDANVLISHAGFSIEAKSPRAERSLLLRESFHRWDDVLILRMQDCHGFRLYEQVPASVYDESEGLPYDPGALTGVPGWLPPRIVRYLPPLQRPAP